MAGDRAPRPRSVLARFAVARPHLIASVLLALAAYGLGATLVPDRSTRLLVAWNIGTGLYVALNMAAVAGATPATIRERAALTDEGRFAILVLVTLAGIASVGAIVAQLGVTKDMRGLDKGLHLGLAGLTVVSAWVFIHLTFALHYAHEYFDDAEAPPGEDRAPSGLAKPRGGLDIPGTIEPDYWDFLYFGFIIGVAAQTADVAITSKRMRRTALAHSILSFFFNSAILALTINIAAGLI